MVEIVGSDFHADHGIGSEIGGQMGQIPGQMGDDGLSVGQLGVEGVVVERGGDPGGGEEWFFGHGDGRMVSSSGSGSQPGGNFAEELVVVAWLDWLVGSWMMGGALRLRRDTNHFNPEP